jgi:hypothetical protein
MKEQPGLQTDIELSLHREGDASIAFNRAPIQVTETRGVRGKTVVVRAMPQCSQGRLLMRLSVPILYVPNARLTQQYASLLLLFLIFALIRL